MSRQELASLAAELKELERKGLTGKPSASVDCEKVFDKPYRDRHFSDIQRAAVFHADYGTRCSYHKPRKTEAEIKRAVTVRDIADETRVVVEFDCGEDRPLLHKFQVIDNNKQRVDIGRGGFYARKAIVVLDDDTDCVIKVRTNDTSDDATPKRTDQVARDAVVQLTPAALGPPKKTPI